MLNAFKDFCRFNADMWPFLMILLTFLGTIAWIVYVGYTIKTFRQIFAQTQLLTDALLITRGRLTTSDPSIQKLGFHVQGLRAAVRPRLPLIDKISPAAKELTVEWSGILKRHDITVEDKIVYILMKNHGKTDIMAWKLHITATVDPLPHLKGKRVTGETKSWDVAGSTVIAPDRTIRVVILECGAFPLMNLEWSVQYEDARGKYYTNCGGQTSLQLRNVYADKAVVVL